MPNKILRSPAAALLAAVGMASCGGPQGRTGDGPDPYNGVIDNTLGAPTSSGTQNQVQTAIAGPIVTTASSTSSTCNGSTRCYKPLTGHVAGHDINYFFAGFTTTSKSPQWGYPFAPTIADHRSDGGGGFHAAVFPHPNCTQIPYDVQRDAYRRDIQFPIVDALPLNNSTNSSAYPPLGLVAMFGVTGVAGGTCNDLKYDESVGDAQSPGLYGAMRSATPSSYVVWAVFDPSIPVLGATRPSGGVFPTIPTEPFWFRGLMGNYLASPKVPTDSQGNILAMDGVILNTSSFADANSDRSVVLPYQPGDDAFSPIVRLHNYRMGSGKSFSDYMGICQAGQASCPTNYIRMANTCTGSSTPDCVSTVFNTIFIVASPQ